MTHFAANDQVNPEEWNHQVRQLNNSVFHSWEWSRYIRQQNRAQVIYFWLNSEDQATGSMAFGLLKSHKILGLPMIKSLSFGSLPAYSGRDELEEMIKSIITYARRENFSVLNFNSFGTPFHTDILLQLGFTVNKRWEFLVNLPASEEELWQRIHSKKRNLIRKGGKAQVEVFRSDDTGKLRLLALETSKRKQEKGVRFAVAPESYYEILKEYALKSGVGRMYLARHQGEIVAGSFFVSNGQTVYYLLSAANPTGLKNAAPDLILWTAITDYQTEGCAQFNLGGVSQEDLNGQPVEESGLYHFKKRYAADIQECYAGELVIKPLNHKLYQLQKVVKNKMPV